MRNTLHSLSALLMTMIFISGLAAQDDIIPGTVRVDATFENISVNYSISNDDNRNSTLTLRYRVAGDEEFKDGAITMRAFPGMVIDGNTTNRNFHAGSIMFLDPGTAYEIEVDLIDLDGGGISSTQFVNTKQIPQPSPTSNIRYVSPGNGGGNGTQASPYLGLQAAADNAQDGDHFIVAAGNYEPFNLLNSGIANEPISFQSETLHGAIIDGGNTDRGIITLGEFDITIAQVIIDGFIIENGRWGIDAQNSQFITVRNNIIRDVDYGFVNRRDNGSESDQYITNNLIVGRTAWPQLGIPGERGVDLRGNNNVVSYNTIQHFGDGVSTDGPPYEVSYSLDIHNNDIQNIVDDLIEVDGVISNARVYANQCFNGRAGVSLAPVYGGPAYVMRNILFNLEISAMKMNRGPSGIVAVHNTAVAYENVFESPDGWQNTYFRNNVFLASRYCFEMFGLVPDSQDDWDYGAYYSTRGGGAGTEWFKWNNVRYAQVQELQNSNLLQANAIEVAFSDFVDASLPDVFPVEYNSSQRDFSPVENSAVIDNGAEIAHLNDTYVTDGMPDRGALEYGESDPQYGHDFDISTSIVTTSFDVEIFPNPFADKVVINGDFTNSSIQIYNSSGQIVNDLSEVSAPYHIDLTSLQSGIYYVHLSSYLGKYQGTYRIVKE